MKFYEQLFKGKKPLESSPRPLRNIGDNKLETSSKYMNGSDYREPEFQKK